MLDIQILLASAIYSVTVWQPVCSQYIGDVRNRMAAKIRNLAAELVKDSEMKIYSIQPYRDQYYRSIHYQMGQMVFHIRDKYKKMVYLYTNTERNVSYWYHSHNDNILTMAKMYQMGMEVENICLMMEEWHNKRETKEQFHHRKREPFPYTPTPAPEPTATTNRTRLRAGERAPLKRKNNKWRHVRNSDFT